MHEFSIVQALLDRVAAEARAHGAANVARVRVALGRESGVDPGLLATAFDLARAGTICDTAELDLTVIEAEWACRGCGRPVGPGERLRCRACGEPAHLVRGEEIVLERLEMEVA